MIPSAAPLPLQLQFHHTPTFLSFPKTTKPQEMEENPSSFKAMWEIPCGMCVHPPGWGQHRQLFLQLCPKPKALDGEQELELPFPAGSRCPHPAGTFPLASCSSTGSRVACCAASPHTSCTSNILKVGERAFQDTARADLLGFVSLSITFPIWLHWEWCGHHHQGVPAPLPPLGVVLLKILSWT